MKILKTILNILFPLKCIICKNMGQSLCEHCLSKASYNEKEIEEFNYTIYNYKDPVIKKAIWSLKYKNKKDLARTFAEVLYPTIIEELNDLKNFYNFDKPILIPIPLSKKRLKERGYNQTLLIAEALIDIDKGKNFKLEKNILIKNKETVHQAHVKNKKERLENLINTFEVKNKDNILSKNIIFIDDVITTGATIKEAKKTLKKSGARKVVAFTIAH